ncbi:hypothetical protein MED222_06390 [Vibrio sp. MED222]|nr:hypothetical protein MED222_06390 [Vibrio sp. MED222]
MKVPNTVNRSTRPMIKPLRKPIAKSSTMITIATASTRLIKKSATDLSTSCAWL